jgi:hypothetical protein
VALIPARPTFSTAPVARNVVSVPGRGFVALIQHVREERAVLQETGGVSVPGRGFVALIHGGEKVRAENMASLLVFQSPGGDSWL